MIVVLNVISFANADVIVEIRYTNANTSFLEVQRNYVRFRHLF